MIKSTINNLSEKHLRDIGIVTLTTGKMFDLAVELLEDWARQLGINDDNIVIGTDKLSQKFTRYKVCSSENFSSRLGLCLNNIENRYVILILDDYKLLAIDNELFNRGISDLEKYNAHVLKLVPNPYPDVYIPGNKDFGMCSQNSHWRINTQPTLFLTSYLKLLIFPNESLWEFEINACVRSLPLPVNIMSPRSNIVNFKEIIKKGKILSSHFKEYGVKYNIEKISIFKTYLIIIDAKFKTIIIENFGYSFTKKILIIISKPIIWMKILLRKIV